MEWFYAYHIKYRAKKLRERVAVWIAWHLPSDVVMWCGVRMTAHATSGEFGTTHPDDVNYPVMTRRWDDSRGGDRRRKAELCAKA